MSESTPTKTMKSMCSKICEVKLVCYRNTSLMPNHMRFKDKEKAAEAETLLAHIVVIKIDQRRLSG